MALTSVPTVQPMARRARIPSAKSTATTEGITRYEKTSSTPAIETELVTTKPNDT